MKMNRGVSDEGLARIAKTVKAQEGPPSEDLGSEAEFDELSTFDQDLDYLLRLGKTDVEIAQNLTDGDIIHLVAFYRQMRRS